MSDRGVPTETVVPHAKLHQDSCPRRTGGVLRSHPYHHHYNKARIGRIWHAAVQASPTSLSGKNPGAPTGPQLSSPQAVSVAKGPRQRLCVLWICRIQTGTRAGPQCASSSAARRNFYLCTVKGHNGQAILHADLISFNYLHQGRETTQVVVRGRPGPFIILRRVPILGSAEPVSSEGTCLTW